MTLRAKLLAVTITLSILILSMLGLQSYGSFQKLSLATSAQDGLHETQELTAVIAGLLSEREITTQKYLGLSLASNGAASNLDKIGAANQKLLSHVLEEFAAENSGDPKIAEILSRLSEGPNKLTDIRQKVAGELAKPKSDRSNGALKKWNLEVASLVQTIAELQGELATRLAAADPASAQYVDIVATSQTIQNFVGLELFTLYPSVEGDKPLSPKTLNALLEYKGRLRQLGENLHHVIEIRNDSSLLELSKNLHQTLNMDYFSARDILTNNGSRGKPYELPSATLAKLSASATKDLSVLVAKASEQNRAYLTQKASSALFELVGLGIFCLLVLALVIWSVRFISTEVALAITRLVEVMTTLSGGETEFHTPGLERKDELGLMAKAVEVFRENAVKVKELGVEEAARQSALAERAEMMGELQQSLGAVVGAAAAGDFTERMNEELPDEDMVKLSRSVNSLVETVDRGLVETGEVLAALANTDLTKRMNGSYDGAFLQLKNDTNRVADRLSDVVGQLRVTSTALKSATSEILAGANDLSERTTRQAATIEETSAAMEQLAETVLENAKEANSASEIADTVRKTAEEGGDIMRDANSAMGRITESSNKISNIIGMIDDIAFQTNLLALNASVEAARAGEAGKGFAVVAVEVRRLAQSAATASSDVKALIDQSVTEVGGGTKLVSQAADNLNAMLDAARKNNELMVSIADKSKSQASSIEEINTAVREMDEATQHNAALVEETNAAIEQTEGQANELDRIVDVFVTATGGTPRLPVGADNKVPKELPVDIGIRGLQQKAASVAKTYLSQGNGG